MSLTQAKILLEKINALYKSMSLDQGKVAPIERDLMLSYVRQLYEAFLEQDTEVPAKAAPVAPPAPPVVVAPPPPPPAPEPVVVTPPPAPVAPPPPPPPAPEPVVVAPPPPPPPAPAPEPIPVQPVVAPPPPAPQPLAYEPPVITTAAEAAPPRIEALFEKREARELSEKLSEQRIDDLTKALAINDKLLYANDLFGKDMKNMNDTLDKLNRMRSMDDAKPLLVSLASRFDWPNEERADTARTFIKLVRRKYY